MNVLQSEESSPYNSTVVCVFNGVCVKVTEF